MKNENGLYFLNHDLLIRTLDSNFSTSHFTILFGILKYALSGSYKHIYMARQGMHKLWLIVYIGATVVTYYYCHCKQENITCYNLSSPIYSKLYFLYFWYHILFESSACPLF